MILYDDILSESLRTITDFGEKILKSRGGLSSFKYICQVLKALAMLNLLLLLLENKYQICMTEGKSITLLQGNLKKQKALSPLHNPHFYQASLCASLQCEYIVSLTGHLFLL